MFKWIKTEIDSHLKQYKNYHGIWRINRESLARAVAIGLFVAVIPLIPFQTVMAIALAILFRAYLPVAFALSWISNPITILPIAYFIRDFGNWLLGGSHNKVQIAIHHVAVKLGLSHPSLSNTFAQYSKEYFAGLPVVAISLAIAGYLLIDIGWYLFSLRKR